MVANSEYLLSIAVALPFLRVLCVLCGESVLKLYTLFSRHDKTLLLDQLREASRADQMQSANGYK